MCGRFCVRCGASEADDNPIIDGLCPKCFVKERTILKLPSKIRLVVCPICGSVYIRGKWELSNDEREALEKYIMSSAIKRSNVYPGFNIVSVKVTDWFSGYAKLRVKALYGGVELDQVTGTYVEVIKRVCPACLRSRGGGYEAILQIRGLGPLRLQIMSELSRRLMKIRRFRESIVEVKEHKEGVDVKLSDQSVCRFIANLLKRDYAAKIIMTWENTGRLGGRRKGKLIISARLPCLLEGDLIEFNGVPAQVTGVTQGRVIIKRLSDGRTLSLNHDMLWKEGIRYLSEKDYALIDGRILNYEGGKAVVQSVKSGNIYYIRPPRMYDIGSAVKVLIYKGKAYLLI